MSIFDIEGEGPTFPDGDHWVAPDAAVIGKVRIGPGVSIWFNVVIRGDVEEIRIGRDTNIQDGSVLHADPGQPLVIGEGVTLGHMVMAHGCTIGDNSLIGIGAVVLNGATIGKNSIVGAKSLVTEGKSFPDGVLILGSPARVARELTADEIANNQRVARHYLANGRRYAGGLKARG
jgi:carbonic anhydrase/acetyltransferase-like protein (isoleucine patch superfamily)